MARKPRPKPPAKPTSVTHAFCGWVVQGHHGDNSSALFLIDHRPKHNEWGSLIVQDFEPLALVVWGKTGYGNKPVSVSYHITDQPADGAELTMMVIAQMCGVSASGTLKTAYNHRYSEMSGYLWTDETFKVGGHDIIEELSGSVGKWCHLNLVVHDAPR
jgi:hypothetical protein